MFWKGFLAGLLAMELFIAALIWGMTPRVAYQDTNPVDEQAAYSQEC